MRSNVTPHIRGKAAVLTAGLVASLALGAVGTAGTAFAAEQVPGGGILARGTAASLAKATRAQAEVQERKAEAVKADRSKRVALAAKAAKARAAKAAKAAKAEQARPWVKPVSAKYVLTAGYNQSGGMWSHKHSGQDFAVPTGTKVRSVHAGTVVTAGWGGAYGNNIVIKHANRTYSQYGHLSKIQVHVGEKVGKGERIGLSGNTGNTTGPHLHFEIRKTPVYGSAVNPLAFLRTHGVSV
jgi:murein DD-endopeptidase MepM/ murein hydrolase activator NlpD